MKYLVCFVVTVVSAQSLSFSQNVADDFDDSARNAALWSDPLTDAGNGQLVELNQRLEYSATASPENFTYQEAKLFPSYNQAWEATAVVSLDAMNFASGGLGFVAIEIGANTIGDNYAVIGNGAGFLPGQGSNVQVVLSDGGDSASSDNLELFAESVPEAFGVRVAYDPDTRIVHTYYDLDTDQSDGEWTLIKSYTIDGSAQPGALSLNWGMSETSTFYITLSGGSQEASVAEGSAWLDDFTLQYGTISDDFDDNDRDEAIWSNPATDAGNGQLEEVNQRVEYSATASPENFTFQEGKFFPSYNQPWEATALVSLDTANFDSGGWGFVALEVDAGSIGDNYVIIGNGAGFLPEQSSNVQAVFSDGGDATTSDNLEQFTESVPETFGVRVAYDPEARIISTYYDLDTDQGDGEWTLLESYTIDGSTQPGAVSLDWGMSDTETFAIYLSGGSQEASVTAGTAWLDNFVLQFPGQEISSGYELWASGIPDSAKRGPEDDASGNGIPNLLQYMYGLDPLSNDTDVSLSINVEGDVAELTHGINESAPDYTFVYLQNPTLTDEWTSGSVFDTVSTFDLGGKTFRRGTLPAIDGNVFFQIEIVSVP